MSGRAWVFGDRIDTDVLAPGALMKLPAAALASHCLEAVRPGFAAQVKPGDFVVAGRAFGVGSSREQAAISLKLLGVRAVIAQSFARIFFRNAFNVGLPALILEDAAQIGDGDALDLDFRSGRLTDESSGETFQVQPIPEHLLQIIDAGGLMAYLKNRRSGSAAAP
ncbi:MAG: 3-isopropylmalate dehydratase [Alphaproteobacteria bacterium]|nr:3-isopropylmalate dehydratase [Alphaproteobacteria bacterium]